jgi:RND family efflux transporter MFP subunit
MMKSNLRMNYCCARRVWLTAILSLLIGACGQDAPVEQVEVARPIKMMSIGASAAGRTLEVPGSVGAAQSADLSFEVSGRMMARMVEEGQLVETSEIVAKLDSRDYVAQRNAARARRDTAKSDYDRYRIAYENNAVTEQQVSRSKGQFDVTQADLDVAEKALQDTELKAPFAGRIARRLVDDFANVRRKESVMVLQDESSLELRVAVAERDWGRGDTNVPRDELTRRINPRVEIASRRGRLFPAYVKEASNSADPVTRTFEVTFGFENPTDVNISPGMTGKIIVDLFTENLAAEEGIVSVPSNAVFADVDANPHVWVVDPATMRVAKRAVDPGELTGAVVPILEGLSDGDIVVVSGINSLTDGMLVRDLGGN